ncbi:chlorophyllase-1-like [Camellia sinensis]|uniref:chlorophyllase-1-like n=1 Tax=Camellia sinensis TaxID=4442 RepID=UPI0010369C16|nr:chlorophyllase-1-like [Camellia sinensis]
MKSSTVVDLRKLNRSTNLSERGSEIRARDRFREGEKERAQIWGKKGRIERERKRVKFYKILMSKNDWVNKMRDDQIEPKILTYVPHSFDLPVPISVAIIGTGLGHEKSSAIVPACAPNGVNHCEFFTECKPPSWYFYAKDYGHVDMLDDPNLILSLACVSGEGDKDPFKKCLGGVFVAFLRACLDGENEDLKCIVEEPTIAPVTLDPVIHIEA